MAVLHNLDRVPHKVVVNNSFIYPLIFISISSAHKLRLYLENGLELLILSFDLVVIKILDQRVIYVLFVFMKKIITDKCFQLLFFLFLLQVLF